MSEKNTIANDVQYHCNMIAVYLDNVRNGQDCLPDIIHHVAVLAEIFESAETTITEEVVWQC